MATFFRSPLNSVLAVTVIVTAWISVSTSSAQTYDGPVFKTAPIHSSATTTTNNNGGEPTQTIIYQYQPPPMPMFDCGMGQSSGGAPEARAHILDKEGPQLARGFSMSSVPVRGFVTGSWPVVFGYELERDSLLIVVVAPEAQAPVISRLNGKKGHSQNRLTTPAQVGTNRSVAKYVIRSLDDAVGQAPPTYF